jgi:hypothetical protein
MPASAPSVTPLNFGLTDEYRRVVEEFERFARREPHPICRLIIARELLGT